MTEPPRAIHAIAFDLFGTLLDMKQRRLPWLRFFSAVSDQPFAASGFDPTRASIYVQTHHGAPSEIAMQAVEIQCFEVDRSVLQRILDEQDFERKVWEEINSVELFEDTLQTLSRLRSSGFKLALVSNLATPYASVMESCGLGGSFDAVVFSFAEGTLKGLPGDSRIYESAARRLGVSLGEILFVGDGIKADYEGPVAAGMQAVHLHRARARLGAKPVKAVPERPTVSALLELDVEKISTMTKG